MDLQEKIVGEKMFHEGKSYKFYTVDVELPNKKIIHRELVKHPGSVAILALDSQNRIVMVEQYRFAVQKTLWEIPAGKLDKISGETPAQGACRELEEETGFAADDWIYLGTQYPSPGLVGEIMHMFLARTLTPSKQNLDEDEFINVHWISPDDLRQRIKSGDINDGKTISTFTIAHLKGYI
ncbi:ADP-ribose pyrophosphatase [Spirochaetia bacterium]|nr:ADP-ribose pyrophosphatase [Spirochaetia bacterium]